MMLDSARSEAAYLQLLSFSSKRSSEHVWFVLVHGALANAQAGQENTPYAMLPNILGWYGFDSLLTQASQDAENRPRGLGKRLGLVMEKADFMTWRKNDFVGQKLCGVAALDPDFLSTLMIGAGEALTDSIQAALEHAGCSIKVDLSADVGEDALNALDSRIAAGTRALIIRILKENEEDWREEPARLANMYDEIGALLEVFDAHEGAQAAYERVLAIRKKAPGALVDELADTLFNLGSMQVLNNQFGQAIESLTEALSLYQTFLDKNDPRFSPVLSALGDAMMGLGDKQGARRNYQQALVIIERVLSENNPFVRDLWFKLTLLDKKENNPAG